MMYKVEENFDDASNEEWPGARNIWWLARIREV